MKSERQEGSDPGSIERTVAEEAFEKMSCLDSQETSLGARPEDESSRTPWGRRGEHRGSAGTRTARLRDVGRGHRTTPLPRSLTSQVKSVERPVCSCGTGGRDPRLPLSSALLRPRTGTISTKVRTQNEVKSLKGLRSSKDTSDLTVGGGGVADGEGTV